MSDEGCARCSVCNVNYPPTHKFVCDYCGGKLTYFLRLPPDEDWQEQVDHMNRAWRLLNNEMPEVHIPVESGVTGRLFISEEHLFDAGVRYELEDDSLIRIGKQLFEVVAHIVVNRTYWIESVDEHVDDDALAAFLTEPIES